jgi:asparagine synthase (glutamine-hydrolysing)
MVSDVPVGVFLSGGYDSSAVAALLQNDRTDKIKTFTIGFTEAKFNEAEYAKKVAAHLGTDHTEEICSYKEAIDLIDRIPFFYDEPFGDSSAIPTMLVSKIARQKVSVSLSADGGDEIFAGYQRYHHNIDSFLRIANIPWPINSILSSPIAVADFFAGKMNNYNLQYKLEKTKRVLQTRNRNRRIGYRVQIRNFTDHEVSELLNKSFSNYHTYYDDIKLLKKDIDYVNMFMAVEFKTTLVDDMLTKVDRATMSYSLEGREPMLDHRLVEFCAQLPAEYKIRNGIQKYILKEIVHKYIPKQMMERPKMGFGIPVGEWLTNELKSHIDEHLSETAINKYGVLNYQVVSKMLNNFYKGEDKNPDRIWIILMLQMWLAKW